MQDFLYPRYEKKSLHSNATAGVTPMVHFVNVLNSALDFKSNGLGIPEPRKYIE